MNLGAFFGNFRLVFFCALLRQNADSVCAGQSTPESLSGSKSTAPGAVETCTHYKVATHSRQLSQEWTIENYAQGFNTSDGKREDSKPLPPVNVHGGNWSFALTGSRAGKMMIEYNATISPQDPNPPNSIVGQAFMWGVNFTREFICFDPSPRKSGWSGRCYTLVRKRDQGEVAQTAVLTLSVSFSLLYASVSRVNATAAACEDQRLYELKSAAALALAQNSTSQSSVPTIVTEIDQQYAKAWKHRISLEWSIPNFSQNLEDAMNSESLRKLAKLRLSKEALGSDWNIDIELEHQPWSKVVKTTLKSAGLTGAIRVLNVTRTEIAFTDGKTLVQSVPRCKEGGRLWFFWFNSRTGDEQLTKLANGVVVLLEYEVIYGLTQTNAELTT